MLSFVTGCIQFIVSITLAVFFILISVLKIVAPIGTVYLLYLIFARRISLIDLWDTAWNFIKAIGEKALVVAVFICIFTTIGSYLDPLFGTTVEFSGAFGIIGAVLGIGFWLII